MVAAKVKMISELLQLEGAVEVQTLSHVWAGAACGQEQEKEPPFHGGCSEPARALHGG